jgi:hypothetical protein
MTLSVRNPIHGSRVVEILQPSHRTVVEEKKEEPFDGIKICHQLRSGRRRLPAVFTAICPAASALSPQRTAFANHPILTLPCFALDILRPGV